MRETRRSVLKRGVLAVGAVIGAGAVGRQLTQPSGGGGETELVLHGRDWHIESRELASGELPAAGQRMLVSGELLDAPDGAVVGNFFGAYFSLNSPDRFGALASLEQHTLQLPGGSIIGAGTTGDGVDSEDEFAIVGGTGRYLGARGSYVVRQSHYEFGGDGTATLTLRLTTEAV